MVELDDLAAPETAKQAEQALCVARRICEARGLRFTSLRAAVLEAIARARRPLGAYTLLSLLQRNLDKKFAPPTVYRSLEFLLDIGVIVRIESRNAYMLREHPGQPNTSVLFLCDRCDSSVTIEDTSLAKLIESDAATLGFRLGNPILECGGTCERCIDADLRSMLEGGGRT